MVTTEGRMRLEVADIWQIWVQVVSMLTVGLVLVACGENNTSGSRRLDIDYDDGQAIIKEISGLVQSVDLTPLEPQTIEIAHMRGSWVFEEILALRVASAGADKLSSANMQQIANMQQSDLAVLRAHDDFQDDNLSPDWLREPWQDGSTDLSWCSITRSGIETYVCYVRPISSDVIIYFISSEQVSIPPAIASILTKAEYHDVPVWTPVGDDWRKWARIDLHISPRQEKSAWMGDGP